MPQRQVNDINHMRYSWQLYNQNLNCTEFDTIKNHALQITI